MVADDAVFMEFVFGCWQLRSTDMLAEEVFRRDWQLSNNRHQVRATTRDHP